MRTYSYLIGVSVVAFAAQIAAGQAPVPPVEYQIVPEASVLQVHTYKGGLFGVFGHEHDIRAQEFAGTVVFDRNDPARSRVSVTVETGSLQVVVANDSADIPEITRTMRERILHVDSFPEISFTSTDVGITDSTIHLRGDLTIVGHSEPVAFDLILETLPCSLRVRGSFTVRQTTFGIRPYSTAFGTVKVKDEITFFLDILAVVTPEHTPTLPQDP